MAPEAGSATSAFTNADVPLYKLSGLDHPQPYKFVKLDFIYQTAVISHLIGLILIWAADGLVVDELPLNDCSKCQCVNYKCKVTARMLCRSFAGVCDSTVGLIRYSLISMKTEGIHFLGINNLRSKERFCIGARTQNKNSLFWNTDKLHMFYITNHIISSKFIVEIWLSVLIRSLWWIFVNISLKFYERAVIVVGWIMNPEDKLKIWHNTAERTKKCNFERYISSVRTWLVILSLGAANIDLHVNVENNKESGFTHPDGAQGLCV